MFRELSVQWKVDDGDGFRAGFDPHRTDGGWRDDEEAICTDSSGGSGSIFRRLLGRGGLEFRKARRGRGKGRGLPRCRDSGGGQSTEELQKETVSGRLEENGQQLSADVIQVRVDDGQIQWHDGTLWHTAGSVEELMEKDRFVVAQDAFLAYVDEARRLEEELLQAHREQTGGRSPNVGQKEVPKTQVRPQTQTSAAPQEVAPTPSPEPAAPPEESWGGGEPDPPAQPDPPADTGDGENMEWSNDYL